VATPLVAGEPPGITRAPCRKVMGVPGQSSHAARNVVRLVP